MSTAQSFSTLALFYYSEAVDTNNFYLDFDEGSGEITAEIEVGSYTFEQLAIAIESALNSISTNTYSVDFLRDERKFEITGSVPFALLIASGSHNGQSVLSLLGFNGLDTSSDTVQISDSQAGSEYLVQFPLQSYVDQEDYQKAVSASINKSASGDIEVVKFGTEKFYEFDIKFITNIDQGNHGPVRTNLTGIQDVRSFLRFATTKSSLEMMLDFKDPDTYVTVLLESTEAEKNGTGYKLKELYTKGLPGYFETGKLTFRLVED